MEARAEPAEPAQQRVRGAVVAVALVAAVVGALSPAHPVGHGPGDAVWSAGAAALVALAASRSRTGVLLWAAGLTAVVSVRGDVPAVVLGLGALAAVLALTATGRRSPVAGATVGALVALALLWGPSYGPVGVPTVVALVAVAPVLVEGWRSLAPRGQRRTAGLAGAVLALVVVAAAMAGLAALSVRHRLTDAAQQARDGLALVRDGEVDEAATTLGTSADDFRTSGGTLDGLLTVPGRFVPVVGQQVDALRRVAAAGEDLAGTAADAASRADVASVRADGGRIDLAQLAAMRDPVEASLAAARRAQATVASVRSPWLLAPLDHELDRLDGELDDTVPSAELAERVLDVAPTLLGADGPQRYLLQFATPGESRAAGGYVGTYGVLVADGGTVELVDTGSTEDLTVPAGQEARSFDPPPGWDELYSTFRVGRFPGNVTADPDWPTDSEVARQLYAQVPQVGPVQGTLYADPLAMAALLQVTGPVYVPGLDTELDSEDVADYLLVQQYVAFNADDDATNLARREVLGNVTRAVFDALTERELPGLRALIDALGPAVAGGHLKVSTFDPATQPLLDEVGLSGAWAPTPGADYLAVRSTDLLSNKIDSFVRRAVDVAVDHDAATGATSSTVTVELENTAPDSGLPVYVIGNYSGLPPGTARQSIALYSPLALEGATLDGRPVGLLDQRYGTGHVYSFPVTIPSGEHRSLQVTLVGELAPGGGYALDLLPQASATPARASVAVSGAGTPSTEWSGDLVRPELVSTSERR